MLLSFYSVLTFRFKLLYKKIKTMEPTRLNNSNRIARCCLDHFRSLPKTGMPTTNEWTVLSAILVHNSTDDNFSVVSLGTGTKCMPRNSLDSTGYLVNDSHAEVLARRGMLRFLLSEICKCHETESNILKYSAAERKFQLNPDISFHFFSTHSPCGDGSIFNHTVADSVKRIKLTFDSDNVGDIVTVNNFTGGKLLTPNQPDQMAQDLAAIRTKPGRGERTASVSCSDKLARWNCVGLQGALLHTILEPVIYFSSLTFCGPNNNVAAIERSIWKRWSNADSLPKPFCMQTPTIQLTDHNISFEFQKRDECQPSPASIVWCNVAERKLEVIVNGRRQGITKKKWNTAAGKLFISKRGLLEKYLDVVQVKYPEIGIGIELGIEAGISYKFAKNAATAYKTAWTHTKQCIFKQWTTKPINVNDFVVDPTKTLK